MKYSKRQIEVWEARKRLSEKLSRMTPEEITEHARKIAEEWRQKTAGREAPSAESTSPSAATKPS